MEKGIVRFKNTHSVPPSTPLRTCFASLLLTKQIGVIENSYLKKQTQFSEGQNDAMSV